MRLCECAFKCEWTSIHTRNLLCVLDSRGRRRVRLSHRDGVRSVAPTAPTGKVATFRDSDCRQRGAQTFGHALHSGQRAKFRFGADYEGAPPLLATLSLHTHTHTHPLLLVIASKCGHAAKQSTRRDEIALLLIYGKRKKQIEEGGGDSLILLGGSCVVSARGVFLGPHRAWLPFCTRFQLVGLPTSTRPCLSPSSTICSFVSSL